MNTLSHPSRLAVLLGGLSLAGCGRDVVVSDVKLAGVGSNPDDIGPAPDAYGGLVEYNWVNIAGDQIPLALLGLTTFDKAGPSLSAFQAPYVMIYGLSFVMEEDMVAPDAQVGTFASPPAVSGACQTVYEPTAFLNSVADVGDKLSFTSDDGAVRYDLGRYPEIYPPDPRDVFTYYIGLESWRPGARTARTLPADGSTNPEQMSSVVIQPANWTFGATVDLSFPGAIPPKDASIGAIPQPLTAAASDRSLSLPADPGGVMLSWVGPRYDDSGALLQSEGSAAACLQYLAHPDDPSAPEDCSTLATFPEDTLSAPGQIYTGPWDTEDDPDRGEPGVWFRWTGDEASTDTVSVTVRFLGPVDMEDESLLEGYVSVEPTDLAKTAWEAYQGSGSLPTDAAIPEGRRAPVSCEEDDAVTWSIDDSYLTANGDPIPTLQGNPLHTLAEVTCTLDDSQGEDGFFLASATLEDAMDYARRHGGEGAVFYFTRSSSTEIATPPVRDSYGKRRDISPLLVVSRAVTLGRFWYGE